MAGDHTWNANSLSPHVQAAANLVYEYLLTENMVNALLAWTLNWIVPCQVFPDAVGFATGGIPLHWRRGPDLNPRLSGFS
jgi:hypothetical protein